ncbi:unnamed protein product [Lactuca saligna]|uniref:GRF-type domain-containing protein n=1 Tax=Lactuca saligna TaxID=75948 RepID=A0AA35YX22_LACSI|nr:unnamed protein product [Lactuca saligna]
MASSSRSSNSCSRSKISKSKSTIDKAHPCDCGFPSRIWISTTKANPGKKFRVCPNSLMKDPNDKCDFWEWVDDDEEIITKNENKKDEEHDFNTEVKIAILEHDFSEYKMKTDKECKSFRKELDKMKCLVLMFVVLFVVKYMI